MKASEFLFENIDESFDTDVKVEISYQDSKRFETRSLIGNMIYIFEAYNTTLRNHTETRWFITFGNEIYKDEDSYTNYGATGTGSEMKVFSFVIKSVKMFVENNSPDKIVFTSDKFSGNRSRLYLRMVKSIKIPGYHFEKYDDKESRAEDLFMIAKDK